MLKHVPNLRSNKNCSCSMANKEMSTEELFEEFKKRNPELMAKIARLYATSAAIAQEDKKRVR